MNSAEKKGISNFGTTLKNIALSDKYGSLIIVIVMVLILSFATDSFLTGMNLMNLMRSNAFYVIIACGMFFVFMGGEIDLSQGSIMCMCGLVSAILAHNRVSVPVIIIVAILIGCFIGFVNGFLVGFVKMPAFIVTLGMQFAIKGLVLVITGGYPVNDLDENFNILGTGYLLEIPIPVYIMLFLCVVSWFIVSKTTFGRHLTATGGNVEAAQVSGINTKFTKCMSFVLSGAFCAVSGLVLCARFQSGQLSLGSGYEMYAIAGCVIGGVSMAGGSGTVFGLFFGTLVMTLMRNGMDLLQVNAYWQQFAQGAIIILAILVDVLRRKVKRN